MPVFILFQPGASVEVKQPDKKEYIEGTIVKIQDLSQYTVGELNYCTSDILVEFLFTLFALFCSFRRR